MARSPSATIPTSPALAGRTMAEKVTIELPEDIAQQVRTVAAQAAFG
jgi:hypothetical protein